MNCSCILYATLSDYLHLFNNPQAKPGAVSLTFLNAVGQSNFVHYTTTRCVDGQIMFEHDVQPANMSRSTSISCNMAVLAFLTTPWPSRSSERSTNCNTVSDVYGIFETSEHDDKLCLTSLIEYAEIELVYSHMCLQTSFSSTKNVQ